MPRKLLTFLGPTDYKPCIYTLGERQSPVVRYVQEALAGMICSAWAEDDSICVFLTTDAERENWEGNGDRLEAKLQQLQLPCQIKPITDFQEGFGEIQIQANFKLIFDNLDTGDEVWLDITNAFRSIPIFATVLLNYARFLKGIKVQAIHYGAFEALKVPAHQIDERIPDPAQRKVPILDLSSLIMLQNWTNAANDFLTHGNAKELAKLAAQDGHSELSQNLSSITGAFAVVRGRELVKGDIFKALRQSLQQLKPNNAALTAILDKLSSTFSQFQDQDILNGFRAAQWCHQHQLYQQGITILRETIVSLICRQAGLPDDDHYRGRKYVEFAFNCFGLDQYDWKIAPEDFPKVEQIINNTQLADHAGIYKNLSHQYRNDINHGGFLKTAKPAGDFAQALATYIQQIQQLHNF